LTSGRRIVERNGTNVRFAPESDQDRAVLQYVAKGSGLMQCSKNQALLA
jgi:hypothetical protein